MDPPSYHGQRCLCLLPDSLVGRTINSRSNQVIISMTMKKMPLVKAAVEAGRSGPVGAGTTNKNPERKQPVETIGMKSIVTLADKVTTTMNRNHSNSIPKPNTKTTLVSIRYCKTLAFGKGGGGGVGECFSFTVLGVVASIYMLCLWLHLLLFFLLLLLVESQRKETNYRCLHTRHHQSVLRSKERETGTCSYVEKIRLADARINVAPIFRAKKPISSRPKIHRTEEYEKIPIYQLYIFSTYE